MLKKLLCFIVFSFFIFLIIPVDNVVAYSYAVHTDYNGLDSSSIPSWFTHAKGLRYHKNPIFPGGLPPSYRYTYGFEWFYMNSSARNEMVDNMALFVYVSKSNYNKNALLDHLTLEVTESADFPSYTTIGRPYSVTLYHEFTSNLTYWTQNNPCVYKILWTNIDFPWIATSSYLGFRVKMDYLEGPATDCFYLYHNGNSNLYPGDPNPEIDGSGADINKVCRYDYETKEEFYTQPNTDCAWYYEAKNTSGGIGGNNHEYSVKIKNNKSFFVGETVEIQFRNTGNEIGGWAIEHDSRTGGHVRGLYDWGYLYSDKHEIVYFTPIKPGKYWANISDDDDSNVLFGNYPDLWDAPHSKSEWFNVINDTTKSWELTILKNEIYKGEKQFYSVKVPVGSNFYLKSYQSGYDNFNHTWVSNTYSGNGQWFNITEIHEPKIIGNLDDISYVVELWEDTGTDVLKIRKWFHIVTQKTDDLDVFAPFGWYVDQDIKFKVTNGQSYLHEVILRIVNTDNNFVVAWEVFDSIEYFYYSFEEPGHYTAQLIIDGFLEVEEDFSITDPDEETLTNYDYTMLLGIFLCFGFGAFISITTNTGASGFAMTTGAFAFILSNEALGIFAVIPFGVGVGIISIMALVIIAGWLFR